MKSAGTQAGLVGGEELAVFGGTGAYTGVGEPPKEDNLGENLKFLGLLWLRYRKWTISQQVGLGGL